MASHLPHGEPLSEFKGQIPPLIVGNGSAPADNVAGLAEPVAFAA
jgi:hypothetical protein